jgi:hypothetical protein
MGFMKGREVVLFRAAGKERALEFHVIRQERTQV